MAQHYRSTIADIAQQFDDNTQERQVYEDIAWAGLRILENGINSIAWDNLSTTEQQRILTNLSNFFTMELMNVINIKKVILFSLLLACNTLISQTRDKDYYTLVKNGRKYLKPVNYIMPNNKNDKKIISSNSEEIIFYIDKQKFKYDRKKNEIDTCSIFVLDNIKMSNIKQLFNDEYEEHRSKLKLEELDFPPPPDHYNLKIFIIEKTPSKQVVKYEVDWIYTIE